MTHEHEECSSCEEFDNNPSDDSVMSKYRLAGEIANAVIKELMKLCVEPTLVRDLCNIGDKMITERTSKLFTKQKSVKKGIGFPTCISLNNCICHYSPLTSDASMQLKNGDLVKIDLGVQIDGYYASVASSLVVGCSRTEPVTDKRADVILAAYTASELAIRNLKVDGTNLMITQLISDVAQQYDCYPIQGLLSYDTAQNRPEGHNTIVLNPSEAQIKDCPLVTFDPWQVYVIDIFVSTNNNPKPKENDVRTTVYRRTEHNYNLKMKASRDLFSQVIVRSGPFAFSLNSFEDESKSKLAIKECLDHDLVVPYPVLFDSPDAFVAQFKYTVVITPDGPIKITNPPLINQNYKSSHKLKKPEFIKMLNSPLIMKKKIEAKT